MHHSVLLTPLPHSFSHSLPCLTDFASLTPSLTPLPHTPLAHSYTPCLTPLLTLLSHKLLPLLLIPYSLIASRTPLPHSLLIHSIVSFTSSSHSPPDSFTPLQYSALLFPPHHPISEWFEAHNSMTHWTLLSYSNSAIAVIQSGCHHTHKSS